jgi:hypothetical protein
MLKKSTQPRPQPLPALIQNLPAQTLRQVWNQLPEPNKARLSQLLFFLALNQIGGITNESAYAKSHAQPYGAEPPSQNQ